MPSPSAAAVHRRSGASASASAANNVAAPASGAGSAAAAAAAASALQRFAKGTGHHGCSERIMRSAGDARCCLGQRLVPRRYGALGLRRRRCQFVGCGSRRCSARRALLLQRRRGARHLCGAGVGRRCCRGFHRRHALRFLCKRSSAAPGAGARSLSQPPLSLEARHQVQPAAHAQLWRKENAKASRQHDRRTEHAALAPAGTRRAPRTPPAAPPRAPRPPPPGARTPPPTVGADGKESDV